MNVLNAAGSQNILVVLAAKEAENAALEKEIEEIAQEKFIAEGNAEVSEGVVLCKLSSAAHAASLSSKLNGAEVGGRKITALTLDKYLALKKIADSTPESLQTDKAAVRKIITKKDVERWRRSAEGEQFVLYNEGVLTNYQVSKIFACKATKSKPLANSKVSAEKEVVLVQKHKNVFVYAGELELLDGFVRDGLVSCEIAGECVSTVSKTGAKKCTWELCNIYTKETVKSVQIDAEEKVSVSKGLTHYMLERAGKIEIRRMKDDTVWIPEKMAKIETGTSEGVFSEHNNVAVLSKATQVGVCFGLYNLDTEEEIRGKVFTNIKKHSVTFNADEAVILNTRAVGDKPIVFADAWSTDGKEVISKALGDNVKSVQIGVSMCVAVSSSCARVFKRAPGKIWETGTVRGAFSSVEIGEVAAMCDGEKLLFVGQDAEVLFQTEVEGSAKMKWSPFGMYLALIDAGQIRVLDLLGSEVFVGNAASEKSFSWRAAAVPNAEVELTSEVVQRFREEDALKTKQAKTQMLEENKDLIQEWREFLERMRLCYVSARAE